MDREDWGYTYANLDSQTKVVVTKEEWYLKNQWFADTEATLPGRRSRWFCWQSHSIQLRQIRP